MDIDAVELINTQGQAKALLLCEHASSHIPDRYAELGLAKKDRYSHAAWDIGAHDLAVYLSEKLDAPLIAGGVSRLVYDCNRPPEASSAMPEKSELVEVPGNANLSEAERQRRVDEVYIPFCTAVSETIEQRQPQALVTIHTFTKVYFGESRNTEIGILHDDDERIANAMLDRAKEIAPRVVHRNQPYGPRDEVTHSLRLHAMPCSIANVMIEVRNDLVRDEIQVAAIGEELLRLLIPALP